MGHAVFSPSKAHRWLRCPASIKLEAYVPDLQTTAAAEGTAKHETVARHLLDGSTPEEPWAQQYVDVVRSYKGALLVERQVIIEPDVCFGTLDAGVIGQDWAVIDAKFGRRPVTAVDNPQLKLYALGLELEYKTRTPWELVIVQPFASGGMPVKTWVIEPRPLKEFHTKVLRAIDRAHKDHPLVIPGDHCWFCKARLFCDEYRHWSGAGYHSDEKKC
jgi:hypothetical protein